MRNETVAIIEAMLQASSPRMPEEALPLFAHSMSGAGTQLAKWWRAQSEVSMEAVIAHHVEQLWHALAPYSAGE